MERIKIDVYISDLLYHYDCVIVPDFGGFVSNYAPAQIQENQHKFNPPSKKISFNKLLKNNDGLLIHHIAKRKAIQYDEAANLIKAFVNQSIEGLKQGDKIVIEKVGTLFMDMHNNIQFKAAEKNDYLLDSFGLTSFRAKPIQRETIEEKVEKKVIASIAPKQKEEGNKKRAVAWTAAASILLLLVFSFLLNRQYHWVETSQLEYAVLSFSQKGEGMYTAGKKLQPIESIDLEKNAEINFEPNISQFQTADGEIMAFYVDNSKEADAEPEIAKNRTSHEVYSFHVMGGCFSNYQNATALVSSLKKKGFQSRLLGKYKNYHAVSYGSFYTRNEAEELLSTVKNSDNSDAWILNKPY